MPVAITQPVGVAVVPVQAAAPIAPAPVNPREIKTYVLAAVSEKTGYPEEVLDLDLDLEADLGIDTVKQAELFAAIRTQYGIARREDLRLSDYNTLAKVIRFVEESLTSTSAPLAVTQSVPQAEAPVLAVIEPVKTAAAVLPSTAEIKTYLLSAVSEKTGYPIEVLDLDLDLEADLGIDTVKQAELFAAIRAQYGIARREDLRLSDYNTLAKVIRFVEDALKPATVPLTKSGTEVEAPTPPEIMAPETPASPVAIPVAPLPLTPNTVASQAIVLGEHGNELQDIQTYVLTVVSEKTGYPFEVLDLNLDLEADLGIDTVKQAELFASIRERFDIPRREDLRLSEYNTLAKVMAFVEVELKARKEASEKAATPANCARCCI